MIGTLKNLNTQHKNINTLEKKTIYPKINQTQYPRILKSEWEKVVIEEEGGNVRTYTKQNSHRIIISGEISKPIPSNLNQLHTGNELASCSLLMVALRCFKNVGIVFIQSLQLYITPLKANAQTKISPTALSLIV